MLASQCGKRPSELFEWNDPDDFIARLLFDLRVMSLVAEEVYGRR